ncbi:hypothetical protein MMC10_008867 [Thelotrema lepadinum]|nr:hypothetical protein [Thelotrema lepadinum]
MSGTPLTSRLLSLHPTPFKAATQSPFLFHAGTGTLPAPRLCKWLIQDKYYQFAYVNFIGRLIAKINLITGTFSTKPERGKEGKESLEWKTLKTLISALQAIKVEIEFYDNVAEDYGLELDQEGEDEVTRRYRQLFEESSAPGVPMLWGLVVLWGTEYCYLGAWTYAKEQQAGSSIPTQDSKGAVAALHKKFIPNWTSEEFKAAVNTLADVANEWAEKAGVGEENSCEELWLRTLELEAKFWPSA